MFFPLASDSYVNQLQRLTTAREAYVGKVTHETKFVCEVLHFGVVFLPSSQDIETRIGLA